MKKIAHMFGIWVISTGFGVALETACVKPNPNNPNTVVLTDPTCQQVCDHFQSLGCDEAKPTPHGASCTTVCDQSPLLKDPAVLRCMVAIEDCDQSRDCTANAYPAAKADAGH